MGLFGFFKKNKKKSDESFSSRRRRVISSRPNMKTATRGTSAGSDSKRTSRQGTSGAQASAAGSGQEVGELKRGASSALKADVDIKEADEELKNFIIQTELGEAADIEDALSRSSDDNPFIKIVVEEDLVNENMLLVELSKKCMIPQGKLSKYKIRKKALEVISPEIAKKLFLLPVDKLGQILSVAVVNPLNKKAIKKLGNMTGLRIKTVVCTYSEFMEQYKKHYVEGGEVAGSEEALEISVDEPEPMSPEEFKASLAKSSSQKKEAPSTKAAEAVKNPSIETISGEEVTKEASAEEEYMSVDIIEAEEVEEVEPEVDEKAASEEQFVEPIIEGIDIEEDEEDTITVEPVIIPAEETEDIEITGVGDEQEETVEYVDAVKVVEEEFRRGIRLGSLDLFKKWGDLHCKKRIITLNPIPEDIFSFVNETN